MTRTLFVMVAAFCVGGGPSVWAQPEPMSLRPWDSKADDWESEHLQDWVSSTLKKWGAQLMQSRDSAPSFLAGTVYTGNTWGTSSQQGPFRIASLDGPPQSDSAGAWPFFLDTVTRLGPKPERITFKVVGLSLERGAGGPSKLRTRVRFEGVGSSAAGPVQQVGTFDLTWHQNPEPSEGWSISLWQTTALDEVILERAGTGSPIRGFVDRTSALLAPSPSDRGGDWWHGRIDAVGESNLFGHQGMAIADVNGDGLEDLYLAMGTGLPNRLLIRQADGRLRDAASESGLAWLDDTKGVALADLDNDGDADLVAAVANNLVVAKNDGAGRFGRVIMIRAPTPAVFYSLALADYDLDGDLDIYACRYVDVRYGTSIPVPLHDAENGPSNHLFRNDGSDQWSDVTDSVGLNQNNTRFSLAAAWLDFDDDGDSDLYVANDFGRNNLYRNDSGRFVDVAAEAGVEDQAAGMGVSVSDYNGDGRPDILVTNMFSSAGSRVSTQDRFRPGSGDRSAVARFAWGNTLYKNLGNGAFEDVSDQADIRMGRWAWGSIFTDFDGDGQPDMLVPNGFLTGRIPDDL